MSEIFSYSFSIGSVTISTFTIIQLLAIVIGVRLFIYFSRRALSKYFKRRGLDEGRVFAISKFVKYFTYAIGFVMITHTLNLSMNGLMLSSAGLFVGIGFGLQQTFSDFLSGIILLVEGDVQVGDQIIINEEIGTIRSIGARTCKIETPDQKEHIIPNSQIVGNHVVNLSMDTPQSRFFVDIGVSYNSDPDQVTKILLSCATKHNLILGLPIPTVQFSNFGDSSLDFKLQFYTSRYMEVERTKSDLRYRIFKELKDNNIQIPFPQRDLWIKNESA